MDKCDRCRSDRLIEFGAKVADECRSQYEGKGFYGYVPIIPGISDACGEYLEFVVCLECGAVQGDFPKPEPDFSVTAQVTK